MRDRAGVVIRNSEQDLILVMRRVRDGKEYYTFPGGTVEEGESAAETAKREASEELSLIVDIGDKITSFENQGRQETYFWVHAYSGVLELGGEEKEHMTENNQYHLEWKGKQDFINIEPFYPKEMKKKIVDLWASRQ